jgi:uncharacterized protein YdeI (YjbR/CyaY-like superfamily)
VESRRQTAPSRGELAIPRDVDEALRANEKAWAYFESLAPSYRRHYLLWITTAKQPETRQKRVKEASDLLAQGKKLGLK